MKEHDIEKWLLLFRDRIYDVERAARSVGAEVESLKIIVIAQTLVVCALLAVIIWQNRRP